MKVAFILNKVTYTSIPLEMADKISEKEDVTVISLYDSNEDGCKIANEVAPRCKFAACNGRKNLIKGLIRLKKEIIAESYDIIHTHQTLSGAIARHIARNLKNTRIVHTVHAHHDSFSVGQNLIIGLTLKYADCIVTNSRTTLEGLKSWQKLLIHNVQTKVIYNGVNVYEIRNADIDKSNEIFEKHHIDQNEYIFGLVGRFVKVKNHANVLIAFERFLNEVKDDRVYRLLLIGDGPERRNIENIIDNSDLLKKNVVLTGMIDRQSVYSILHKIDTFVMASFHEGFCNALMEARVAGAQVIISKIDIFTELYENENRITFDPHNIDEIKSCMLEAINKDKNDLFSDVIEKRYDLSTTINQYLDLYHTV